MGRMPWSNRLTVEECKIIDIPWLRRHDYFCGYRRGGIEWKNAAGETTSSIGLEVWVDDTMHESRGVRLTYTETNTYTGEKTDLDYTVDLDTAECNFGGMRYWFICPLVVNGEPCGRKVGKLYLPPGGKYFGCRHCYNLTYRCQKEHDKRVDALLKNPRMLTSQLENGNLESSVAIRAYFKLVERLAR